MEENTYKKQKRSFPFPTQSVAALSVALSVGIPSVANAFCGFYVAGSSEQLLNNATEVALMRRGTRTVLTMSNHYQGPPSDFAMVVPVPVVLQQDNVKTLPHNVFDHFNQYTAPRLVEYWERDPCYVDPPVTVYPSAPSPSSVPGTTGSNSAGRYGVRVEAQFAVGEYQIVILSATQSDGLESYLRDNHYNIPRGAAPLLAPYIREGFKFFVAKVDITKVTRDANGGATLSPLRFHYDSPEFRLPVRLGLLNAPDSQDLIVYIVSPEGRFETTNYRNVFMPTNLDVTEAVKSNFANFYGQLFDATLATVGGRGVVTEYSWEWPAGSSCCDPCTGPPVVPAELAALGGDMMFSSNDPQFQQQYWQPPTITVTRLHTRYNAGTLTEDLIFRQASPMSGGREVRDANNELERGAVSSPTNNFQARYAIRHPWTGAIRCANPRRGIWVGPPDNHENSPQNAGRIADVPRASMNLASVIQSPNPGVDLGARLQWPTNTSASNTSNSGTNSVAPPSVIRVPASRGCACNIQSASNPEAFLGLGFFAFSLGTLFVRSRKRNK